MRIWILYYKESGTPVFIHDSEATEHIQAGLAVFVEKEKGEKWRKEHFAKHRTMWKTGEITNLKIA